MNYNKYIFYCKFKLHEYPLLIIKDISKTYNIPLDLLYAKLNKTYYIIKKPLPLQSKSPKSEISLNIIKKQNINVQECNIDNKQYFIDEQNIVYQNIDNQLKIVGFLHNDVIMIVNL